MNSNVLMLALKIVCPFIERDSILEKFRLEHIKSVTQQRSYAVESRPSELLEGFYVKRKKSNDNFGGLVEEAKQPLATASKVFLVKYNNDLLST